MPRSLRELVRWFVRAAQQIVAVRPARLVVRSRAVGGER